MKKYKQQSKKHKKKKQKKQYINPYKIGRGPDTGSKIGRGPDTVSKIGRGPDTVSKSNRGPDTGSKSNKGQTPARNQAGTGSAQKNPIRAFKNFRSRHATLTTLLTALMLILFGAGLGLINLYCGTGKYAVDLFSFYMESPGLVLLNILPFVALTLALWLVINRSWIAVLISGAFCLFYSWAAYWKLMARSEPIYASDLAVIDAAAGMSKNYIGWSNRIAYTLALVLIGILAFVFIFNGRIKYAGLRALPLAILIGLSAGVCDTVYLNDDVYNSFAVWDELNQWLDSSKFMSRGCIYPFIYSTTTAKLQASEGYSDYDTPGMLASYESDDIAEDKKVNVLCFMLEAFSDLSDCTDKIDGDDPYSYYHELCDESYCGRLITNIFSGGTINSERCFLTGFSKLGEFETPSWSYVRYLSDQGYSIQGSHPSYEDFYNRINVNKNLGFDDYLFYENHYSELADGAIATDDIFMPEVLRLFKEEVENGNPVFSFNVTYQNHGPYDDENCFSYTEHVSLESAGSLESYNIANNYLDGVNFTSARLAELKDELAEMDEPVVLLFFGDHKPWLGDQNSVYEALDIDLDSGTEEAFCNYYSTEYVIWANDAAKETLGCDFTGQGPDISPCYLMNELFNLCGWDGPSYMKLSEEVQAVVPVATTVGKYRENDAYVDYDALSDQAKELLTKMDYAQYYLATDWY